MIEIREDVKRHGYRKARVLGIYMTIRFAQGDTIDKLRDELAHICGACPDNHETYVIFNKEQLVIQFSDWIASFGSEVLVKEW